MIRGSGRPEGSPPRPEKKLIAFKRTLQGFKALRLPLFHYFQYGSQKFLSARMADIVGSPEEAESFYKQRFAEAFADFRVEVNRRPNESYAYQVIIHIL